MLWLLFTTGACNLKCTYCGGSLDPRIVPWRVTYDIGLLKRLIEADDEAVVIFYGGEPLLNPGFIMKVMDNIRAKRFGIQTNGILVNLYLGITGGGWMWCYYPLMAGKKSPIGIGVLVCIRLSLRPSII